LQDDSALAYRLLPVTTNNTSLFPLDKSLPTGNQFYFFVNDHDSYSGRLRDYLDFINEEELLTHVSKLAPFDSEDPQVVRAYIKFFNTVGSHFVTSTGFGARFQLVGVRILWIHSLIDLQYRKSGLRTSSRRSTKISPGTSLRASRA